MYRVVPIRLNELVTKSSGLGSMTQAGEELENFQQGRIELNFGRPRWLSKNLNQNPPPVHRRSPGTASFIASASTTSTIPRTRMKNGRSPRSTPSRSPCAGGGWSCTRNREWAG